MRPVDSPELDGEIRMMDGETIFYLHAEDIEIDSRPYIRDFDYVYDSCANKFSRHIEKMSLFPQ